LLAAADGLLALGSVLQNFPVAEIVVVGLLDQSIHQQFAVVGRLLGEDIVKFVHQFLVL
jgi:hypothetical protein